MTIEASNVVATMKQALEALEAETDLYWDCNSYHPKITQAIISLRQAIEQAAVTESHKKQEPCKTCNGSGLVETGIGRMACDECKGITGITLPKREWVEVECPLCGEMAVANTHPNLPKREWVGLTDEEKDAIYRQADAENWHDDPLLEAVEAKLKEKNTP